MPRKSTSRFAFFARCVSIVVLLCGAAFLIIAGKILAFFVVEGQFKRSSRVLTFTERVAYQQAIEAVYWRHRIWPKERPDPKPPLNAVMQKEQLEKEVADYLGKSQALEKFWHRPLTADQLQAEVNRMARNTKDPDVLRELFQALRNDPFVIAECLARPALAERLLTNWYAFDERIHGELKERAQAELQAHSTIDQMKQTTGEYREIEMVKTDSNYDENEQGHERGVTLNGDEWGEAVQKLAGMFDEPLAASTVSRSKHPIAAVPADRTSTHSKTGAAEVYESIPIGKLSSLQEDATRCFATAVINKAKDRIRLATVTWSKEPVESWRTRTEKQTPIATSAAGTYSLPTPATDTGGCTVGTWAATSLNPTRGRFYPSSVWTGTEMIVWGGYEFGTQSLFKTGARYNPSTDTWVATRENTAPEARVNHTAVWTGTEMIVWGGNVEDHSLNTGGRYNPTTDSWTATSTTNAPHYRAHHTAVWTGTQMIIWGGTDSYSVFNTGGKYDPITNSWVSTSTTNAPQARYRHTAVWTGGLMIVWGGNGGQNYQDNLDTGGRYNPNTNMWSPTSTANAPQARWFHTAVWTGGSMIVWGGSLTLFGNDLNTGGRYTPSTNTWSSTSTISAPSRRDSHTAVWTGTEMIVWGGFSGSGDANTGGRYHPATNSWTATSTVSAPSAREGHTAVWSGTEMLIWGGGGDGAFGVSTGGRYDPITNTWATTNGNAPTARTDHTAIWTGSEMIVWGGQGSSTPQTNTGGRFNPSTDTWTATSILNAPSARVNHTAVWTGSEMIVWGGEYSYPNFYHTGGRYNPVTNSWRATSTVNAPSGRHFHTAVWTGSEMIVWGGELAGNTGGRYNPGTDSWVATSITNAPSARYHHTAIWTGSAMIIWGGTDVINYFDTGAKYNPVSDTWTPTSLANAPSARQSHTAIWTGIEMIVWGGRFWDGANQHYLDSGGRYNPVTNNWTATSTVNAPTGREFYPAVWTGTEMIVWGGLNLLASPVWLNTGGRYNPTTDSWTATSLTRAPTGREQATGVWTGREMIIWGGNFGVATDTGGKYCARSFSPTPTPTSTPTPTPTPIPPRSRAAVADFNGDGRPDYVVHNINTRQTAIWYLDNNIYIGSIYGPTLPTSWKLGGVADFNLDGHPDYALFTSNNNQTVLAYMSGPTVIGAAYGPTLPPDWELVATGDFNGDNYPDYLLYNTSTRQTQVWYLNDNVYVGSEFGPSLPLHWTLVGIADFNGDGHTDYLLYDPDTGGTLIAYLSGVTVIGAAFGPTLPRAWPVVASADFNGDGSPDYLLYKADTRETAILYLQNNLSAGAALGPPLPAGWSLLMQ